MTKRSKKLEKKQGKATITKQNKDKTVEEFEEDVGDSTVLETTPCNVGVSLGFTEPDPEAPYANSKASVSLYIPCSHEEIDETFKFAEKWVKKRLQKLYDGE